MTSPHRRWLPGLLLALLLPTAAAAEAEAGPPADVAELLAPWAGQWQRLQPAARARLVGNARRWQALAPEDRDALMLQLRELETLPSAQRVQLRARRQALDGLPPEEQAAVVAAAERYAAADPEQQQAWRERFDALDLAEQRHWLLGPTLGASLQRLRPLFAWVRPDEREASLAMLVELDPAARAALEQLVRRLPPAEREPFRRSLLEAAPADRAAIIQRRLDGA